MLGEPASAEEVWFVLHGYRQLAPRFIRRFEALPGAGRSRAVVAPEALSRFYIEEEVGPHGAGSRVGASWMTRSDREHEIRDYVEYLDRLAWAVLSGAAGADATAGAAAGTGAHAGVGAPPGEWLDAGGRRIVLLGFSQGAETASRWATYGRIRPDELVLWGGGLAVDLEQSQAAEALARMPIRLLVGTDDRWGAVRSEETLRQLRELGLQAQRVEHTGGHVIAPEALREHWPEGEDRVG